MIAQSTVGWRNTCTRFIFSVEPRWWIRVFLYAFGVQIPDFQCIYAIGKFPSIAGRSKTLLKKRFYSSSPPTVDPDPGLSQNAEP